MPASAVPVRPLRERWGRQFGRSARSHVSGCRSGSFGARDTIRRLCSLHQCPAFSPQAAKVMRTAGRDGQGGRTARAGPMEFERRLSSPVIGRSAIAPADSVTILQTSATQAAQARSRRPTRLTAEHSLRPHGFDVEGSARSRFRAGVHSQGSLRRDRSDGCGVSRELPGVVRDRPH